MITREMLCPGLAVYWSVDREDVHFSGKWFITFVGPTSFAAQAIHKDFVYLTLHSDYVRKDGTNCLDEMTLINEPSEEREGHS